MKARGSNESSRKVSHETPLGLLATQGQNAGGDNIIPRGADISRQCLQLNKMEVNRQQCEKTACDGRRMRLLV